jgi:hypothetical protein
VADPDREALGRRVRALWQAHPRLARSLAWDDVGPGVHAVILDLAEQLAREAAAAEREACACVAGREAGRQQDIADDADETYTSEEYEACHDHGARVGEYIAAAIRARGSEGS